MICPVCYASLLASNQAAQVLRFVASFQSHALCIFGTQAVTKCLSGALLLYCIGSISHRICTWFCCALLCCGCFATIEYIPWNMYTVLLCIVFLLFYYLPISCMVTSLALVQSVWQHNIQCIPLIYLQFCCALFCCGYVIASKYIHVMYLPVLDRVTSLTPQCQRSAIKSLI